MTRPRRLSWCEACGYHEIDSVNVQCLACAGPLTEFDTVPRTIDGRRIPMWLRVAVAIAVAMAIVAWLLVAAPMAHAQDAGPRLSRAARVIGQAAPTVSIIPQEAMDMQFPRDETVSGHIPIGSTEEVTMWFADHWPSVVLVVALALVLLVAFRLRPWRLVTVPLRWIRDRFTPRATIVPPAPGTALSKLDARRVRFAEARAVKRCAIDQCSNVESTYPAVLVQIERPLAERIVRRGRGAPIAEYRVGDDASFRVCTDHRAESLAEADALLAVLAVERLDQEANRAGKVRSHRLRLYETLCERQQKHVNSVRDVSRSRANGAPERAADATGDPTATQPTVAN